MIKLFKFITGEDIIAKLIKTETDVYTLENPLQLLMIPTANPKQPNFGFSPYPIASRSKILYVLRQHILWDPVDPLEEFVEQYESIFSSIILPPKAF